jgi:hypothetical protein
MAKLRRSSGTVPVISVIKYVIGQQVVVSGGTGPAPLMNPCVTSGDRPAPSRFPLVPATTLSTSAGSDGTMPL